MLEDTPQVLGLLKISLHFPQAQSLKDKRMILRSLKDRVGHKFNVSLAELDGQDKWQVATLGFAMVSNDSKIVDSTFQQILDMARSNPEMYVCDQQIDYY